MFGISSTELIIIGLILLVFLGGKKVAELGKSAGEATRELKKVKKEFTDAANELDDNSQKKNEKEVLK